MTQALNAFFFPTTDDLQLFGVARGPQSAPRVWLLCPPFAEEEKSSRRLFTLISQTLAARGEASLLFSFRGTGDSEGDFAKADLSGWKSDLKSAKVAAMTHFHCAIPALLGVRLGASLAWQEAHSLGATRLILIEPLVSGRSFLMQQNAKKQIRAQLTGENAALASPIEDLDGWELGSRLKAEMSALDLRRETPHYSLGTTTLFQVGAREEVAPPLQALVDSRGGLARAVVMPPFWNLVDAPDFSPLLAALQTEFDEGLAEVDHDD